MNLQRSREILIWPNVSSGAYTVLVLIEPNTLSRSKNAEANLLSSLDEETAELRPEFAEELRASLRHRLSGGPMLSHDQLLKHLGLAR